MPTIIDDILQQWPYFNSLEEFAYYLGLIGLLLAIMQFGMPYSIPYIYKYLRPLKYFKNTPPGEVFKMINKIIGYVCFWSLLAMPLILVVFVFKLLMTISLVIGVVFDSWIILLISAFVIGVITYINWRSIKKDVTDSSIILPKTEAEVTDKKINMLSQSINVLSQRLDAQNKRLETVSKDLHSLIEEIRKERRERK